MKIPVDHGWLEANLREAEGERVGAAVMCHPHPLHGGTMHTKAVFRTAQAFNEVGVDCLRFNFRGVGASTGTYGDGVGEQDDVRAALDWLEEHRPGVPLVLGGFSFGSMVALNVGADDDRVRALLGLGIPTSLYDFDFLKSAGKPILIVQGEEDEFATGDEVEAYLTDFDAHIDLVRIPGADHYFNGHFDELIEAVSDWFREGPGGRAMRG